MKSVRWLVILLTAIISCSAAGCGATNEPYKETQFLLDTVIEITAYGPKAEPAVKAAMEEFRRIRPLTDHFDPDSQLSKINQQAGVAPVVVDPELIALLQHAQALSEKMDGAFDVSVGAYTTLWGVGHKGDYVPSAQEIDALRPLVDYRQIQINPQKNTVYLPKKGMYLDLGGVAKGAALNNAVDALKRQGITSALVNAGGDVRVIGRKPDGKPWRIGVQDPRDSEKVTAKLTMDRWDTLETSGDYQRFFEKDGIRYHHIIDPKNGRQPREIASVTLIYRDSPEISDVASSGILVLGVEKGLQVLQRFPGVEAIIVTADGRVIATPGLGADAEISASVQ